MASNLNLSLASVNAMANALCDLIDTGGAGKLYLYSDDGTPDQPATADTAIASATLLAELTFSVPCEDNVTNGVITFDPITADSSANATGTAVWFRIKNGGGTTILDGSVGTSGCDLNMNTTSIVAAANVAITTMTLTVVT